MEKVKELTRESLIKITMDGSKDFIICRWCLQRQYIPFPFYPVTIIEGKKKIILRNRSQYIKHFLELHYGRHMRENEAKK